MHLTYLEVEESLTSSGCKRVMDEHYYRRQARQHVFNRALRDLVIMELAPSWFYP